MSPASNARIVAALAERGYNADRGAVSELVEATATQRLLERTVEQAPDDAIVLTREHVRAAIAMGDDEDHEDEATAEVLDEATIDDQDSTTKDDEDEAAPGPSRTPTDATGDSPGTQSSASTGTPATSVSEPVSDSPGETGGSASGATVIPSDSGEAAAVAPGSGASVDRGGQATVTDDVVSTGTGEYGDFVSVFRDRYEALSGMLRSRVNHRPATAMPDVADGSQAALVGMITDIRTTKNGHWRIVLEDTTGTFPCLILTDRDVADQARHLMTDEVVAVEGTVANGDGDDGIMFVDDLHFPDIPRTYRPSTADRHVRAALVSDLHVGSQEFRADAWKQFADWLHTEDAERVEYLLVAGDMVEGVGVYPGQDEELDIVDIYDQYEAFNEHLKDVPGDVEVVLIPGNHDAVRLAEPQPAFDEQLRGIMSAHDARIAPNPATVTIEGVSILMYHGVSLDELVADLPAEVASYEEPHRAMAQLLKKRHLAPKYGGRTRIAPEDEDHMVIDEIPDVFHAGHVHKLGYGTYHNVLTINSSCWQAQTSFQESVNIDPDVGFAPIVDLDTLELTIRQFT